jgi:hypothetical protein
MISILAAYRHSALRKRTVLLLIRCQFRANLVFWAMTQFAKRLKFQHGRVAERFKAPVLKFESGHPSPYLAISNRPKNETFLLSTESFIPSCFVLFRGVR